MYQKCVCFIFLVILAILSCSGFRIDNLAMTDLTKKNFHITRANGERYIRDDRPHRIRHHRLWRTHPAHNRYPKPQVEAVVYPQSTSKSSNNNNNKRAWPYESSLDAKESVFPNTAFPDEQLAQVSPTDGGPVVSRAHRSRGSQQAKTKGRSAWSTYQREDLLTKAYRARFVFSAILESKTPKTEGSCGYYVRVRNDFKGNVGKEFSYVNNVSKKSYKRMLNADCDLVRLMKLSKKYLLLLNDTLGLIDDPKPMRKFKKSKITIKNLKRVCKPGFKPTKPVVELKEIEEKRKEEDEVGKKKESKRRKLVCSVKGFPPPKITWGRRNEILHRSSSFNILYKRRQSKLVIKTANAEHWGQYYCIAENANGETTTREYTLSSLSDKECIGELKDVFCSNGGTCFYEKSMNEAYCNCPEGFSGRLCEAKNPSNTRFLMNEDPPGKAGKSRRKSRH